MVSFLWSIENQFSKQSVLVISHGDCLQILLAWFQGYEAHHHRKMVPIQTTNMCSLNNVRTLEEIQQLVSVAQDHAARGYYSFISQTISKHNSINIVVMS